MNFFVQNGHVCNVSVGKLLGNRDVIGARGKCNFHSGGTEMLRQTLITLTAVAALGIGSTAMAAHGGGVGGHGGGGGGGHWGGGGGGFGGGGAFAGARSFGGGGYAGGGWRGGSAGPMMMRGSMGPVTRGPITTAAVRGPVQGWNGPRNNLAMGMRDHRFHDHFHNRFRNRNFFAFGFGGPFYDYAYDSCWIYYGWQWVNVCGGYGY
jgi:hypothetical protein